MAGDQTPPRSIAHADAGPSANPPTEHVYDGIEVSDNPLPGWWKWLLLGTVVLSVPYYGYYHFGGTGRNMADRYEVALAEHNRLMFAQMGDLGEDTASLVQAMEQPSLVSIGRSVFRSHCISCHGPEGGGLVGPNLTDDAYKNVRELTDIVRVVRHGAAAGAMPAWNTRLDRNEIILVAVYAAALRGTSPTGPAKGPEGNEIAPWPTSEEIPVEQEENVPAADDGSGDQGGAETAPSDQARAGKGDGRSASPGRLAMQFVRLPAAGSIPITGISR